MNIKHLSTHVRKTVAASDSVERLWPELCILKGASTYTTGMSWCDVPRCNSLVNTTRRKCIKHYTSI